MKTAFILMVSVIAALGVYSVIRDWQRENAKRKSEHERHMDNFNNNY